MDSVFSFIGDKDSKNTVSLNLYSSLKFVECCHFILTVLLWFAIGFITFILQIKKKGQRHDTVTSLDSWKSNACFLTPMPLLFPLRHTFSSTNKRMAFLLVWHSKLLAVEEGCCSGKNSRLSDRPVLPLTSPWWSLSPLLPLQFHYPANTFVIYVGYIRVYRTYCQECYCQMETFR